AEKGGVTELIAKAVGPLFRRLFPGIPDGHPASGAIVMNRSANMLGLDNAATPLGLKAMKELQSLNATPDTASNELILLMGMLANLILIALITSFLVAGAVRRIPLYEVFIEGAKEGFQVAVGIVPYLVAILVGVGVLRASGALEAFLGAIKAGVSHLSLDSRWVDALPTALIKPLSGGGARGMMVDTMKALGADSFAGRLSCVIQGSTETTFYVLAVYFGSVGVRKTRHALPCALAAETIGVLAAIAVTYLFSGRAG